MSFYLFGASGDDSDETTWSSLDLDSDVFHETLGAADAPSASPPKVNYDVI